MNHQHDLYDADSRVKRTRRALFEAFAAQVMKRHYDEIRVADIIDLAGVARSTFYQHFKNKEDLLADSMQGLLSTLADVAVGRGDPAALDLVLEHFWDNRHLGRIILTGQPLKPIARALAGLIEKRSLGGKPAELWAIQSAEGQLGLIRAWLSGAVNCPVEDLVTHLVASGAKP